MSSRSPLDDTIGWLGRRVLGRYFRNFARRSDIENLYTQLSAMLEIRRMLGPDIPLTLRGWAISPDALLIVLNEIVGRTPARVLEFGAGESTLAIAGLLKVAGGGLLTTIEHDECYVSDVSRRIERAGVREQVRILHVPTRDYESRFGLPKFSSYDLGGLDVAFDVALVDGPPAAFGEAGRSVPLDWCIRRLEGERVVYLDDALRAGESRIVDALRAAWPNVNMRTLATEKGLLEVRSARAVSA